MKKKPDSISESRAYEGIRLYREDIELILSVFHEHGYTVQITDKEFQFDSLDELIDKRGIVPTYFKIEGTDKESNFSRVSISFYKERIHLHNHSYTQNKSIIIFTKIRDICELRMSTIYKILNPVIYKFGFFLVC